MPVFGAHMKHKLDILKGPLKENSDQVNHLTKPWRNHSNARYGQQTDDRVAAGKRRPRKRKIRWNGEMRKF